MKFEELRLLIMTQEVEDTDILDTIKHYEYETSKILKIPMSKITLRIPNKTIDIDLSMNRHVYIREEMLTEIKTLYNATSYIIVSPIRCKLYIILDNKEWL